jgi:hypothetical protein
MGAIKGTFGENSSPGLLLASIKNRSTSHAES